MKSICISLAVFIAVHSAAQTLPVAACQSDNRTTARYPKADSLQKVLDQLTQAGVPGAAMAVVGKEGYWEAASGWASIEQKLPMQPCHLQYLQSISKTYMAVAILQLYQQGKINLDAPITQYLKTEHSKAVTNASTITVRMLLNHTSGITDYNFAPAYVAFLLQHPEHRFKPEDYLQYIDGKKADFAPGARYSYRNINYVLLALMADAITGDHARYISEHIFQPLQLKHTFYRHEAGYLTYATLPNTYWDRNSNGIIENVSGIQRGNVMDMVGDDGIVTTPHDAVYFLKGLNEGQLLHDTTLQMMKHWVKDSKGNNRYGLGLAFRNEEGHTGFGHSGGGIGAGCELYYFPKQDIYAFVAINLGTVTDSPLHQNADAFRKHLYEVLLED
jgi:D-alanyl-D-alanine carboxypeptidase